MSDIETGYIKDELESIMTQQILISQLAKGISYTDTENMDEYERTFIYFKLMQLKKEENEAKLKAIKSQQQN